MGDLAGEACREVLYQPGAGQGPDLGEDVVLDEEYILDLRIQSRDEAILGLCAAICLHSSVSLMGYKL